MLDADATAELVDGLVHLETQRAPAGLDLTADAIYRVQGAGSLDFGGSEFEPAERLEVTPELADPGDDYGWWELEPGTYVVRYNEGLELEEGQVARIYPLGRLLQAGASHPAFVVHGEVRPLETLLTVGEGGCGLKENCRVSRLLVEGAG